MLKSKAIVGLTGSIGMGKSTVARMFLKCGATLIDADQIVRELLSDNQKTISFFLKNYPTVFHAGRISRKRVAAILFSSQKNRRNIESFLHPFVKKEMKERIKTAKKKVVVLEVPLLFETGFDRLCDYTVCASAGTAQQKKRVMKRNRMSLDQYRAVLKRQYSDQTKRRRANAVIDTSVSQKETRKVVNELYKEIIQ